MRFEEAEKLFDRIDRRFHLFQIDPDELYSFRRDFRQWTKTFGLNIQVKWGISRIVFVTPTFVIKMNRYEEDDVNAIEVKMYKVAEREGFEYLFAKPETFYRGTHLIIVMPTVPHINEDVDIYLTNTDYLDYEEREWVYAHVSDLHSGNYGFDEYGNPVIFDYAACWEESFNGD